MQRKKGTFITFIFSMIPGAGEMYLGFMKKGISVMFIFFFTIFISAVLNLELILFILPMTWFYSFFSVHNMRGLPDDEFYALEDDYIISSETLFSDHWQLAKRYHKVMALILILIGVSLLWNNLTDVILYFLPAGFEDFFWRFHNFVPRTLISVLLILGGGFLIYGKKKQLDGSESHSTDLFLEVEDKRDCDKY